MTAAKSKLKRVLFLCTGNSCRSQMAEGWTRHLKSDSLQAFSAGTNPHSLNPLAIQVMKEVGVDISHQTSKHVAEFKDFSFDLVITVCDSARESCPVFSGNARTIHVGFDDPPLLALHATNENEIISPYRRVRDEIRLFVETLS